MIPHRWLVILAGLQHRFPILKAPLQAVSSRFRNCDAIMQNGIGRGLRFNTGGSIASYSLGNAEPDLQNAQQILTEEGMVVFDVGANVGFFTVLFAKLVGPTGQVFAFEPVPANASQIEYNARLNGFANIQVENTAVGEADGTSVFRISDFSTTGKLRSVGTVGVQTDEIPVPTCQLDNLVLTSRIPAPSLIKIDTEGAEVAILKGAARILQKARPILLVELHGTNDEIVDLLEKHDYCCHVLGSAESPREAHWNSRIVAAPRELDSFKRLIPQLTDPRLME